MSLNAVSTPTSRPEQMRRFLTEYLFNPLDGIVLSNWSRLLWQYGHHIPFEYWPRAAFTTMMAGLNSAVAGVEDVVHRKAIEKVHLQPPVFVLGHHRSGTTHLWNLLSQDPGFAYPSILQAVFPHSFLVFESMIKGIAKQLTIRKRPQDNVEIDPDSPIEEERAICTMTFVSIQMVRHFPEERSRFEPFLTLRDANEHDILRWKEAFRTFARKLAIRHGAHRRLLFKSPDHTGKLRLLRELFPNARFVHIHRDPFTVFQSTQRMEMRTGPIYQFQRWPNDVERNNFILWRYRTMYDAYMEDAAQTPSHQLVEVEYTQLDKHPMDTIKMIYQSLNLELAKTAEEAIQRYIRQVSAYKKNAHSPLSDAIKKQVVEAWRPSFERWGYSTEGH